MCATTLQQHSYYSLSSSSSSPSPHQTRSTIRQPKKKKRKKENAPPTNLPPPPHLPPQPPHQNPRSPPPSPRPRNFSLSHRISPSSTPPARLHQLLPWFRLRQRSQSLYPMDSTWMGAREFFFSSKYYFSRRI